MLFEEKDRKNPNTNMFRKIPYGYDYIPVSIQKKTAILIVDKLPQIQN